MVATNLDAVVSFPRGKAIMHAVHLADDPLPKRGEKWSGNCLTASYDPVTSLVPRPSSSTFLFAIPL